ncbi:MAG: uroporphyrinogen decarboxylase family protein [Victivallales bacterium]
MTDKERMHAALEGRPVDRTPGTMLYSMLYYRDHFSELTGRDSREMQQWLASSPEEHYRLYAEMLAKVPFETLQPQMALPCEERESTSFEYADGGFFRIDKRKGTRTPVEARASGDHASDYAANETQTVFNKADMKRLVKTVKAEVMLKDGRFDYITETARRLGNEQFIISGGNTGILWPCVSYLGQTNMLVKLIDDPELIDELSKRLMEQVMENIRACCALGGDAFYIDDAMCYSDVISVEHYERFSLPYLKQMVAEIHRHNHKAILIYFGGVMDRLEQIASSGADGLLVEARMKNYTNDIDKIAETIGRKISLVGNIDPVGMLQNGSDEELVREIKRQAQAGKKCRGFIMSTGSPITPSTPLARVQRFIELGKISGK